MARQTPTQAQRDQVFDDFDTFQLPLDASLNLGNFTAYGTTDPAVDLSMVNIAHLNTTRNFRGIWAANPMDLGQLVQYTPGQVVIGSDNHLYILRDAGDPTIDPAVDNGTNWTTLSVALEAPVTELTADSLSQDVNLFAATPTAVTFQVDPSANATLLNPSVEVTANNIAGSAGMATISDSGVVSYSAPAGQTDETAEVTLTVDSRSTSMENGEPLEHEGGQIDLTVNYVDARQAPLVTPEGDIFVDRLATTQGATLSVDIVPPGTSTTAGTAYDVTWRGRSGTNMGSIMTTDGTYSIPNTVVDTTASIEYMLPSIPANGQNSVPATETRNVRAYLPWYWIFSETAPTSLAGATAAIMEGNTETRAFSTTGDNRIALSNTVGVTTNLWFLIDASVTTSIRLNAGITALQSAIMPESMNVVVQDAAGNDVAYRLYMFRVGLVQDPTVFNILTA